MTTPVIPDWRAEARELRAARAHAASPIERIALDNQVSSTTGLPVGLLLLALESEERDAALDAYAASKR